MPWTLRGSLASERTTAISTPHLRRMDSKSTVAGKGRLRGSAIELESAEKLRGIEEVGDCGDSFGHDIWDSKSAEV